MDITIVPYIKEFILKIEFIKWDQVSNVSVWNLMVAVVEKGRILIKLFLL